jgi:hypothetical protein
MAEISKGQVNLNTVLASLGTAGFAGFNLGNLFGGNHCNDPNGIPVSRYEADLMNKINELTTEVKFRDSSIYTDQKILEAYKDLSAKISAHDAAIAQQAVYNATLNGAVGCVQGQVATLQNLIQSLTSVVVKSEKICPTPMPLYNSWTAPVAPAATTGA